MFLSKKNANVLNKPKTTVETAKPKRMLGGITFIIKVGMMMNKLKKIMLSQLNPHHIF